MHEVPTDILDRGQLLTRFTARSGPTCVIMVGAPGSGKTTIAEAWEQLGITVISLDRLLVQKPWLLHVLDLLGDEMDTLFGSALDNGYTMVEDNLNIDRAERMKLAKRAQAKGFHPVFVFIDAPLELCLSQNRQRTPRVPDARLTQLWQDMQNDQPDVTEGEVYRLTPITEEHRYHVQRVVTKNAKRAKKPFWKIW
jgi:predicted kinase